ncbi:Snf7 family [Pyronema domesticum]|uniref:Similar to Vacuolar protein-sorting-associated protein 46 acc. no. O60074 n=1 Tax=Pyronema omphalodes (strain CBS 100304) TaxID=1076935 RepID=U4LSY3_PYROM|nr:Snf7 family [Pyronema domesticum]CCX32510.1 Similar to Vacuolar protein-sorting-associated protein 46; acc. no. O60074 [Pyronema omphalodes CBS 100304]
MSGLENSLIQLKVTAKELTRKAAKAAKEETAEKAKIKKAMMQGNNDIAKLYADNAIRKQKERLQLLQLASKIDAVASRIQTAVTMRRVAGDMAKVVKKMEVTAGRFNPENISKVMEQFEMHQEELDVTMRVYENTTSSATAVSTPQEDVDRLLSQVADEAGLEMHQALPTAAKAKIGPTEQEENGLNERLRALRG